MGLDLPEGWSWVSAEEIVTKDASILYGILQPGPDVRPNGVPYIRPTEIQDNRIVLSEIRHTTDEIARKYQRSTLKTKDIILSMVGTIGKVAFVPPELEGGNITQSSVRIRVDDRIDSEYVFHCLRSPVLTKQYDNARLGTAVPRLNVKDIRKLEFPLAPYPEQKRIATRLDSLLARVDACKARLAKVPEILKRFRQSVLAAACSGRLTADWRDKNPNLESAEQLIERIFAKREEQRKVEFKTLNGGGAKKPKKQAGFRPRKVEAKELPEIPEQWAWIYLPDLGYMSRGKSRHRPRNAPHLYGGPYPFIQTGDIAQSGGRITSHRQTYSEDGLAQSRIWPAGTVCITIAANIASSAILTYQACFPDSVVGVNPNEDLSLAEYLEFFIRTARADLDQFAPATSQKNINIGILSEVAVPLPSCSEQQEIIRRVEALFKLADLIEKRVAAATVQAEKLTQAILAKAFRGELVPTEAELARGPEGRSYEPASALLAKIEAQRKGGKPQRKAERYQQQRKQ